MSAFSQPLTRIPDYPFSAKKDLIDACARLYDMDPVPPIIIDERMLEPETFMDGI